jgi:nucleolar protein 56
VKQDKAVADLLAEGDDMAIDHEMIDAPLPSTETPKEKKSKDKKEKKDKEEKKDKKDKKRRHSEVKDIVAEAGAEVDGEKKKKKKKRHSEA